MQTKLTLRLDEDLIEDAKAYAAEHGRSVSQLVADYFQALSARRRTDAPATTAQATPILDGLTLLLASRTTREPPAEDDYYRHIEAKHLHGEVR